MLVGLSPDPLESLLMFHRRVERCLASLAILPVHLETCGVNAEASARAGAILHCLGPAMALHHAEEERDLLPMLERRIGDASALGCFRAARQALEGDHREIESAWKRLRRPLQGLAEGLPRRFDGDDIQHFRALCAGHISVEEASLHFLALRHLLPEDRTVLGQRIRARRERGLRAP